ncbi:MAG: LytS/YhcK type 5TM receptor domain-containing protein, partial [Acutalibacteraceae bacterium]
MPYMAKQVIIGVLFGAMSAFASSCGVEMLGVVVNVRDAAPVSAALIFGAPAGIISCLIGGAYRWFSVLWGAGTYTRLACSLATVIAGFFAAGLRRFMFENKKPMWGYGIAITAVCEVIHMLLIFITNMKDTITAFQFVKSCTLPMLCGNCVAVGLGIISVTVLSHEKIAKIKGNKHIAQTFQRWLLVLIVTAYFITNLFTFVLQQGMSKLETNSVITLTLDDVYKDIIDASDKNLLELAEKVKTEYTENSDLVAIAQKYDVSEVNIIDENFVIVESSVADYVGYDMSSGEQSAEFIVLLEGETEFVQEYRQTSYNEGFLRKYGGVTLEDGGFIQIGYDPEHFQKDISSYIVDATKNRHVGKNGFVVICDEEFNIVSDNEDYNGKSIQEIGLTINTENMTEKTIYECEILGNPYLFGFTAAEGFYIIGTMPTDEAMFMRDASLYTNTFMQILIFATLFVFIYFMVKRVIINNLQKVNDSLAEITDGNLNMTVDVRSNAEFASLSDDINSMVKTLKEYIKEASARIDKELEYAKQIQLSALPANFPEQEDYGVFAEMIAAKEVGGDFYDFYKLNDETVAFLVADVSG